MSGAAADDPTDYRRYLFGFASVVLLIVASVWAYTLYLPLNFQESGYAVWRAKFDAIESCSAGADAMLGDSRAEAAFIPKYFSARSQNLALGGSTPVESYLVLQKLAVCLHEGDHLSLSIGSGQFSQLSAWLWENGARYGFISLSELLSLEKDSASIEDRAFYDFETRVGHGLIRDAIYGLHVPSLYAGNLISARVFLRREVNLDLLSAAKQRRGFLPFGYRGGAVEPVSETREPHFHVLPLIDWVMHEMIRIATARGVIIDFVSAPITQRTNDAFTKAYRAEFKSYLKSLAVDRGPGLHVVGPAFNVYPDDLFSDISHLSERGAERFTQWFAGCRFEGRCDGE